MTDGTCTLILEMARRVVELENPVAGSKGRRFTTGQI
jgi:hypothetical protein